MNRNAIFLLEFLFQIGSVDVEWTCAKGHSPREGAVTQQHSFTFGHSAESTCAPATYRDLVVATFSPFGSRKGSFHSDAVRDVFQLRTATCILDAWWDVKLSAVTFA